MVTYYCLKDMQRSNYIYILKFKPCAKRIKGTRQTCTAMAKAKMGSQQIQYVDCAKLNKAIPCYKK